MPEYDENQVIGDFLEGGPRAEELRLLRRTLTDRLIDLKARRRQEIDWAKREKMDTQIATLEKQVEALATEEAVTQFVEDSIRATLSRPRPLMEGEEEEEL